MSAGKHNLKAAIEQGLGCCSANTSASARYKSNSLVGWGVGIRHLGLIFYELGLIDVFIVGS